MAVRMLTFNIWFSDFEMVRRMHGIGDAIAEKKPHLVALQEMTLKHFEACMSHPTFQQYHWTHGIMSPKAGSRYFTVIGSLRPFQTAPMRYSFSNSRMGRDLLAVATQPDDGLPPLVFGTSHLESLDCASARAKQLREALPLLQRMASARGGEADVVFCGDTNINESIDGVIRLPPAWQDAWEALNRTLGGSSDPGYTFDVEQNLMMASRDDWAHKNRARLRFDRFFVKLARYTISHMEIVGTQPIPDSNGFMSIWPSDHFGALLHLDEKRR
jgi:hypothetical protein